jgi:hypothetical protein
MKNYVYVSKLLPITSKNVAQNYNHLRIICSYIDSYKSMDEIFEQFLRREKNRTRPPTVDA